jgi:transposase
MWYVGLDWADTHHDVEVMDQAGKRVGARRFPHSHEGLNAMKEFVLSIATSPEQLACIVETNHGLLITFLLEAGIPVYPVNPKVANQLPKAAGAKTDQIDAHLLAKMGRFELAELRRLEPDSPTVAELKTLTRDQDALIQTQTRLVNQLTAFLLPHETDTVPDNVADESLDQRAEAQAAPLQMPTAKAIPDPFSARYRSQRPFDQPVVQSLSPDR